MKYQNPVLRGFYPDPSVCCVDGVYYMVCSSFQYFPGVPLFESRDLVNWEQIGHVLTRPSQIALADSRSSGGVFAATIRYNDGRFYMTTTNTTTNQNFYVWTDDIRGEWSDPVYVEQDGIDPSLYFEDGKCFFTGTGLDDFGENGIIQSQIDIVTGKKLTKSRCIWKGTGGRFVEGPHIYKIGDWYYLLVSEGGTEYGHMLTLARAKDIWGPYESCPHNPILTNRNRAPFTIQAIGHGELLNGPDGNLYMVTLGIRQISIWMPFHHLGREVFLTPAYQTQDGWFTCGKDGTTDESYDVPIPGTQQRKQQWTFENTRWDTDWCFLRHPDPGCYDLRPDKAILHGTEVSLNEAASPTFVGLRQRDFRGTVTCKVRIDGGQAGLTAYMTEQEHYDLGIRAGECGYEAFLRLCIGESNCVAKTLPLADDHVQLEIRMEEQRYHFFADGVYLGSAQTKYLSSEVATGFTGVMLGLWAEGKNTAQFTGFECTYI